MVCVLIEDSAAFIYMHLLIGPHEALWERALLVSNFNRTEVRRRLREDTLAPRPRGLGGRAGAGVPAAGSGALGPAALAGTCPLVSLLSR